VALPDPALVVLIGASGSGKSAWAAEHYRPDEVVSSDRLRAVVGSGEHDLDASADAFAQRHHAGTADEHIGRYRLLADRGVKTVFVSLPHLADPEDIGCLAPVAAAFA
jgi:hypothetical protein